MDLEGCHDFVLDVESPFEDHDLTKEEAKMYQDSLSHLRNLRTSGILLECLKVLRVQKTILWRLVWSIGLPTTIAQTALFAATNLLIVVLTTYFDGLFHDIFSVERRDFPRDLLAGIFYMFIFLALWWGTTMLGLLNFQWSSVYVRHVAILISEFYAPKSSSGDESYGVFALAQLLCLVEDQNSTKGSSRGVYAMISILLVLPLYIVGIVGIPFLVSGHADANVNSSVLFMITGTSLLSNFLLPLSTFVESTEHHETCGSVWTRAEMLTSGQKSSTTITLRILLYALCIPQILAIITFSAWIIRDMESGFLLWHSQPCLVPLSLLVFNAVWGIFNTMVSTTVAGVLYFSCIADHGDLENATVVPNDMDMVDQTSSLVKFREGHSD